MDYTASRFGSPELQDDRPILGIILTSAFSFEFLAQFVAAASCKLGKFNTPHIVIEALNIGKFEDLKADKSSASSNMPEQPCKEIIYAVGSAACRLEDSGVRSIAIYPQLPKEITKEFKLLVAEVIPTEDTVIREDAYASYLADWYCRQVQKGPS